MSVDHVVINNEAESRYELRVDGRVVGIADYHLRGDDTLVFPHTEIVASLRGRGLGEELIRGALDDVRARGLHVVPLCWFVAQYIDDHPDYRALLAA